MASTTASAPTGRQLPHVGERGHALVGGVTHAVATSSIQCSHCPRSTASYGPTALEPVPMVRPGEGLPLVWTQAGRPAAMRWCHLHQKGQSASHAAQLQAHAACFAAMAH